MEHCVAHSRTTRTAQVRFRVSCEVFLSSNVRAALHENELVVRQTCRRFLTALQPETWIPMHHRVVREQPLLLAVVPEAHDWDFNELVHRVVPLSVALDLLRFVNDGEEIRVVQQPIITIEEGVNVEAGGEQGSVQNQYCA